MAPLGEITIRLLFAIFPICIMASPIPSVLIVGHSVVKRLHSDLQCKFDLRAALDLNLTRAATVSFHGVGGLTVRRLAGEFLTNLPQGCYS